MVSLSSDCEPEVGIMAEQYERQRKKRRKTDRLRSRGAMEVFKRIRQYSYSSSDPADDDALLVIDEKALPEMNLFAPDDHEEVEAESDGDEPQLLLLDINDLLDRILLGVEKARGKKDFGEIIVCDCSFEFLFVPGAKIQVNKNLVEPSDFDCVLCYRLLWRPVVTPCGHTYCSVNTKIVCN